MNEDIKKDHIEFNNLKDSNYSYKTPMFYFIFMFNSVRRLLF